MAIVTGPLDRPPSDRHEPAATEHAPAAGSTARAVGYAALGGGIVALLHVAAAGLFALTAGLIVIAFFMGRIVGIMVKVGAGPALSTAARQATAIVLSLGGIAAGFVGTWVLARAQGGVLSLLDYLGATFEALVPLEFMVATLAAWWSAR